MNYIVIFTGATPYPVCHGPFSSFAQACEWACVPESRGHDLETDGLQAGIRRVQIRPLYKA